MSYDLNSSNKKQDVSGIDKSDNKHNEKVSGWVIACLVIAFVLIISLFFFSFYFSSTGQTNTSDIKIINDEILTINNDISAISYNSGTTSFSSNVAIFGDLTIGSNNVISDITAIESDITAITYSSSLEQTNVTSNMSIPSGYALYLGAMNVEDSINKLNEDLTTGIATIDELLLQNLTVSGHTSLNTLNGISSTTLSYLDATSSIQTQLNDKAQLSTKNIMTGSNAMNGGLQFFNAVAGYYLNGDNGVYQIYPIICTGGLNPKDCDDAWIVNPGFKILIYDSTNYETLISTFDNTNGFNYQWYIPTQKNKTASVIVYYQGVQVNSGIVTID